MNSNILNKNIQPTFMTYIAGLEQSDLVDVIADLVKSGRINEFVMDEILRRNEVAVPPSDEVIAIANHNLKKIGICYQTNYNGVSINCEETVDGTSNEDFEETDEMMEIDRIVGEAIAMYAYENDMVDQDTGKVRAMNDQLEEISRSIAHAYLGDVEIAFEIDTMST